MFARVLMAETTDDADDFLRIRRIGQLPADLFEVISGRGGNIPQDAEPAEEVVAEDTDKEAGAALPHSVTDDGVSDVGDKNVADAASGGRASEPVGGDPRTPVVSGLLQALPSQVTVACVPGRSKMIGSCVVSVDGVEN